MNNKYYRITCNKIGIYEYLKRDLVCNKLEKEWKEFINSEKVNWLKKPPVYNDELKKYYSYFTEKGYEMFNVKTLPLITKWIDLNLIVVEIVEIDKEKIVYSDEYQIVVENKSSKENNMIIKKIMDLMEDIEYGFLNKNGENIFLNENVEKIFNKEYHLMSPKELLIKKVGVCWDQVELERKLFEDNNIKNETYFIYIDDKKNLPSHTFLVYFENNKVFWFEHSWFDEKGIHEYMNLHELLIDVESKFIKSREKEVKPPFNVYIYKYNKPKFNISCDEFYDYIYTQEKILNYKFEQANYKDLERIKKYKLTTIFEYAKDLSQQEINKINNYVDIEVSKQINDYKNIIYNGIVIGSVLVRSIDNGLLIDEIFIENEYRNKGIGTSIIKNILSNRKQNIYLWVYKDNIKAIKLYKKLGFTILEKTDSRYYMINKL